MRLLHTADWHLGRSLEGRSRRSEQEQMVDEICALADDEDIHLVIIAGDVFDSANPPAFAEELFYDAVDRLSADGKRGVLVIAGNHDNPERLCASAPLAVRQNVVLLGKPGDVALVSPDKNGPVADSGPGWCEYSFASGPDGALERAVVAALPYPSQARLDEALVYSIEDEEVTRDAYSTRVGLAFEAAVKRFRSDAVNLAVSHLYVAGGAEADSERPIQVGGAYTVEAAALPSNAQYVALGHLHRPQGVRDVASARYAGSPLAYSFSEAGQAKSVTLVDVTPKRMNWREIHLSAGRPLVRWRAEGGLEQVEQWIDQGRDAGAWIDLELHLVSPLTPEQVQKLRGLHPGLVSIRPVFAAQEVAASGEDDAAETETLTHEEQFRRFYARQHKGAEPDSQTVELFLELLAEAFDETEETGGSDQ
ncbi:MAG: exonuclease SbcCD subunit D [Limnochordia bacterium]|jgi:exonuclease SbcD